MASADLSEPDWTFRKSYPPALAAFGHPSFGKGGMMS